MEKLWEYNEYSYTTYDTGKFFYTSVSRTNKDPKSYKIKK